MKRAIVTLAIGDAYRQNFDLLCRKGWSAYAERHGYDLVVIKEPLDVSERARKRSLAWQKCLVLGAPDVAQYEQVVWIDSDIYINPAAPSVMEGVPLERVGVVDDHRLPTPEIRQGIIKKMIANAPERGGLDKRYWQAWLDPGTWHAYVGLPGGQRHMVQTGVMVMSPKHHRAAFDHVYHSYEDSGAASLHYEARPLSHEIQAQNLAHWIDPRFNALVWWLVELKTLTSGRGPTQTELHHFLLDSYQRYHFLHFAGVGHLMPLIGSIGA